MEVNNNRPQRVIQPSARILRENYDKALGRLRNCRLFLTSKDQVLVISHGFHDELSQKYLSYREAARFIKNYLENHGSIEEMNLLRTEYLEEKSLTKALYKSLFPDRSAAVVSTTPETDNRRQSPALSLAEQGVNVLSEAFADLKAAAGSKSISNFERTPGNKIPHFSVQPCVAINSDSACPTLSLTDDSNQYTQRVSYELEPSEPISHNVAHSRRTCSEQPTLAYHQTARIATSLSHASLSPFREPITTGELDTDECHSVCSEETVSRATEIHSHFQREEPSSVPLMVRQEPSALFRPTLATQRPQMSLSGEPNQFSAAQSHDTGERHAASSVDLYTATRPTQVYPYALPSQSEEHSKLLAASSQDMGLGVNLGAKTSVVSHSFRMPQQRLETDGCEPPRYTERQSPALANLIDADVSFPRNQPLTSRHGMPFTRDISTLPRSTAYSSFQMKPNDFMHRPPENQSPSLFSSSDENDRNAVLNGRGPMDRVVPSFSSHLNDQLPRRRVEPVLVAVQSHPSTRFSMDHFSKPARYSKAPSPSNAEGRTCRYEPPPFQPEGEPINYRPSQRTEPAHNPTGWRASARPAAGLEVCTHQGLAEADKQPVPLFRPSLGHSVPNAGSSLRPILDPISRHHLINDLKRVPVNTFKGEPRKFHSWLSSLKFRMKDLDLHPMDTLDVLQAHTAGAPQRVVEEYRISHGDDPFRAVEAILEILEERFGSVDEIRKEIDDLIDSFLPIHGNRDSPEVAARIREFRDLCFSIQAHFPRIPDLITLNCAAGLERLKRKLPDFAKEEFSKIRAKMRKEGQGQPSFRDFCEFLKDLENETFQEITIKSFPMEQNESSRVRPNTKPNTNPEQSINSPKYRCSWHQSNTHDLAQCSAFASLDSVSRLRVTKMATVCQRCLSHHPDQRCNTHSACEVCNSVDHHTLLHLTRNNERSSRVPKEQNYEQNQQGAFIANANVPPAGASHQLPFWSRPPPACPGSGPRQEAPRQLGPAQGPHFRNQCVTREGAPQGRDCSKTLLVDLMSSGNTQKTLRIYAILDEQSCGSFVAPFVIDYFNSSFESNEYTISTLTGTSVTLSGRIATGLRVKGVNEKRTFNLPNLYENPHLPDSRNEVATPSTVSENKKLSHLAHLFTPFDQKAHVGILLGRDAGDLMFSRSSQHKAPFACKTRLGWAVVGQLCEETVPPGQQDMRVLRTTLQPNPYHDHYSVSFEFNKSTPIFSKFPDDEEQGISVQDAKFLSIINDGLKVNNEGHIQAPLPLKSEDIIMPKNCEAVRCRSENTLKRLRAAPEKLKECLETMQKYIDKGQMEPVPEEEKNAPSGKEWYIPVFPVVHPRKKKLRLVFDSAASFRGVSLNSVLLQGPDTNNHLRGVLLRFREGTVAFTADVEGMFHSFHVEPSQRDLLKFFWYRDNDPTQPLSVFRARVHVFGNCSSPAIATICMRKAAELAAKNTDRGPEETAMALSYINKNFYVDDGLGSADTVSSAITTLQTAKEFLSSFNIRLHKVSSSHQEVTEAFPVSERGEETLPIYLEGQCQRTLGVAWHMASDNFILHVDVLNKPFTKRGVLSTINSIFDPLGFASPVTLTGRLIQRMFLPPSGQGEPSITTLGWDEPLPSRHRPAWNAWKETLCELDTLPVARCFIPADFGPIKSQTLHIFSDASVEAIGHVIYLRSVNSKEQIHVAFVRADSKVAPRGATTIPRLELCAAVEAARGADHVYRELTRTPDQVCFYSDSMVVLGYIANKERRFSRYVTRRVALIQQSVTCGRWGFVPTNENPADLASRGNSARSLSQTRWLQGPKFLWKNKSLFPFINSSICFADKLPEMEIIPDVRCFSTTKESPSDPLRNLYKGLSNWWRIQRAASATLAIGRSWLDRARQRLGIHLAPRSASLDQAPVLPLVAGAQRTSFGDLLSSLHKGVELRTDHPLCSFSPFLDKDGLVRVGGRLRNIELPSSIKHPLVIPREHPMSKAIATWYHQKVKHQGVQITHGAIRDAGFFLPKGNRLLKNLIERCAVCRRLRGRPEGQIMADLPFDRLDPSPPFTNTGIDVLGPFSVSHGPTTRRRRGTKKVWAALFVCLASRAVHVEMLPGLDTATFMNALRRFLCIRGNCKLIRSDCGTNFIGSLNETVDFDTVIQSLKSRNCLWLFNPPHASHFGGAWERKIGQLRRALDSSLLHLSDRSLSEDDLHTFLQEAANIVNNTPLWNVSDDANEPQPLTPAMLLTLREEPLSAPSGEFTEQDRISYGKRRWRRAQYLANTFWKQWKQTYIHCLQERRRWVRPKRNLTPGDIVLLIEDGVRRNSWPLARVTEVRVSDDGRVRSATIKVSRSNDVNFKTTLLKRPVHKLVLVSPEADSDRHSPALRE